MLYLNVLLRSDKNKKLENDFVFNKSFDIIVCSPQGDIDDQKWINQPAFPVLKKKISWLPVVGGVCYPKENILVDLFDSGSGSCTGGCTCTWHTSSTWGHTSGHTTWGTSSCLVKLGDDWIANAFNLEKTKKNIKYFIKILKIVLACVQNQSYRSCHHKLLEIK